MPLEGGEVQRWLERHDREMEDRPTKGEVQQTVENLRERIGYIQAQATDGIGVVRQELSKTQESLRWLARLVVGVLATGVGSLLFQWLARRR